MCSSRRMDDFYAIFGVQPDATNAQIKARYRFLAQAYHPDKFATDSHKQCAEETFKKINEAFQTLSNPRLRANYDRKRAKKLVTPPPDEEDDEPPLKPQRPSVPSSKPKTKPQTSPVAVASSTAPPASFPRSKFVFFGIGFLFLASTAGIGFWFINSESPSNPVVVQTSSSVMKTDPSPIPAPATDFSEFKGDLTDFNERMKTWAIQGKADAQEYLGRCYATGTGGLTQDFESSVKWYKKSANQGRVNSQYALGESYYSGDKGVSRDFVQAYKWLSLAVNQGDLDSDKNQKAQSMISNLSVTMTSDEASEAKHLVKDYNKLKESR